MDSTRFYEYPATYAAIQPSPTKNYGSLTPAKAKKSWGDLLKITGKNKKQTTSPSVIYAHGLNLPQPSYQASPYGIKQLVSPSHYGYQNGSTREYNSEYHQKYPQYNSTYSRATPVVQYRSKESKSTNGGRPMTYTDWFGSVVSRKSSARPSLPAISSRDSTQGWENYVQPPPQPYLQLPTAVPVQLLNNVCLCPEQLFSTKTKTKKKCKKCGCKIATIRNATTTAATRVRPAIPANLYQPPPANWRWSSPAITQNYSPSYPIMPSTFSAVREEDTPPHTPETVKSVKSFRSGHSNDSNATITRRRNRQSRSIPPPPTAPLPQIPPKITEESKNSIIKETKTAYQLLEEDKELENNSDPDNLSDNAVDESWEILNGSRNAPDSIRKAQSTEMVNGKSPGGIRDKIYTPHRDSEPKSRGRSLSYSNLSSPSPDMKGSTFKSYVPFSKMSREETIQTRLKSGSSSAIPSRPDNTRKIENSRYGYRGSSQQLQNTVNNKGNTRNSTSSFHSSIPKRDEKKVVSIAGQRILFDRGPSQGKTKVPQKSQTTFFSVSPAKVTIRNTKMEDQDLHEWDEEDTLEQDEDSEDTIRAADDDKPEIVHNNTVSNGDTKWSSYLNMNDNTIQEEDEYYDDDSSVITDKRDDNLRLNKSNIIPVNGHTNILNDSSSSDTSPLSRSAFQATLSELLQVKSILKRPNSIDTSSETDSDFYLPTYTEYKQMQRKKKSVQFRPSAEVNLLEDAGESKGRKVSSIRQAKKNKEQNKTKLFIPSTEPEPKVSSVIKISPHQDCKDNQDSETTIETKLETQNELSDDSSTLCLRLNGSQTIDTSENRNANNTSTSQIEDTSSNNRTNRKYGYGGRGIPVPSRPTVPPPPPPCIVNSIPENNELDLLDEEGSSNSTLIDEFQSTSRESSPSSTPPPLPTSSPPPLDYEEDNVPTFTSFQTNDPTNFAIIETENKPAVSSFYEGKDNLPSTSRVPIFANTDEDSQTATIKSRRRLSKPILPTGIPDVQPIYKDSIRKVSSNNVNRRDYNNFGQRLSFMGTMVEDGGSEDRFSEHIYEELRSIASSPSGSSLNSPTEKSIFDGASKYEILEFLQDARKRVQIEDEDEILHNDSLRSQMEHMTIEEEEREASEDPLLSSIYRDGRSSNRSSNSDSSETSALIRTDKERLKSGEIERTDSGVGSETSKPMIRTRKMDRNMTSPASTSSLREGMLNPCDDCDSPVEATETTSGVVYVPLVCRRCSRRRQERKEILLEIVETEVKYGRDLKVMMEQFFRPIQVAGLLSREQLRRIFLNIEELIYHNRQFSLQLKDAYEIALDQGDEDLLTVNVARLFIHASPMLHSFQNYCVRQSEASLYLQNLEKDRELLRIFLKVSQMENTLLRRMNLHSFLMVPVQRITKYPLLLSRLYKTTPPTHSSREDCRKAREKIEVYLQHINDESRGTSSTKLWRRISMSVAGNNIPPKRLSQPPDCDISAKIRNIALEILDWNGAEATVIREGRLLCLPPDSGNWTRRGRSLKMVSVQAILVTLGRPSMTLEEAVPEDGLITPRNLGIKEAALLAFKDHRLSKSALLREPWLLSKVVLSWDSEGETESFELTDISSKETYIFKDRDSTSTEEWFRLAQFHGLSVGTWRGRRTALANIMINGARRFAS